VFQRVQFQANDKQKRNRLIILEQKARAVVFLSALRLRFVSKIVLVLFFSSFMTLRLWRLAVERWLFPVPEVGKSIA